MKVWLFKLGEQTPLDPGMPKLSRTAMLADEFATNGHEVHWFMSTFDHLTKTQRSQSDQHLVAGPNYTIHLLHTPGYKKNVSLARHRDHELFDKRLRTEIQHLEKPDLIVAAYPTIGACKVLTDYASAQDVPIFIDVRDMWPDIFSSYLPALLKPLYPYLFRNRIKEARYVLSRASGLIAITDEFLGWALGYAERSRSQQDYVAPLAYTFSHEYSEKEMAQHFAFWKQQGIGKGDKVICFFGVMSKKIELDPVAEAMKTFSKNYPDLKLVLCGTGDELSSIQAKFAGCDNVLFPGWINKGQIKCLMDISILGLAPYVSERPDFLMSVPTKIIEYFAGHLPIVTSLKGVSLRLVQHYECGAFYDSSASFVDVISARLDNHDLLESEGKNAFALYQSQFCGEFVYKDLRHHLELTARGLKRIDAAE